MLFLRARRHAAALLFAVAAVVSAGAAELEIPGSGNPEFVLGELATAFNQAQTRHKVSIPPSTGTAGAIRAIEENTAVLARVGRPLKDEEARKGITFVALGRDAVVFVGGAGVGVRQIRSADALAIYAGKITDWKALGGKPGAIRAIGRETSDASRGAMGKVIKEYAGMSFPDSVKVVHLDPQAIELLDRFPGSLAVLNRSALSAAKTRLVPLALDGVAPTPENLAAGSYPVWLDLGLIHKSGTLPEPAREFIDYIRSPAGLAILRRHGVQPPVAR